MKLTKSKSANPFSARFLSNFEGIKKSIVKNGDGFTLIEVLLAAAIMIILCVGTLSVFSYAVKINRGNNLRSQALTALQAESELYRSFKFVPGAGLSDVRLNAGTYTRPPRTSADGTVFNITVTISNISYKDPSAPTEANCTLKQIYIQAVMANAQSGWLANLNTNLTILRVRAN
jgi:type II secretory pathway pseudopilin PulG